VQARDEAIAQGITINGLPIMLKRPSGLGDMENLDLYYRDCGIGGQGERSWCRCVNASSSSRRSRPRYCWKYQGWCQPMNR
jgi:Protein of unknown function (DUF1194)